MDALGAGVLLLIFKWVFIALIYFILIVILLAVRKEMSMRLQGGGDLSSVLPGRLRILQAGSDGTYRPGTMVSLKPITRLGSESDNDLIFRDPFISKHHARIQWDGVEWWLEDLDSRNGTQLRQERLAPFSPLKLESGAVIRLGDVALEFVE